MPSTGYQQLFAMLFLLVGTLARAAVYVDDTNCANTNPGTYDAPWCTFEHAFDNMDSGETLIVRDGVYSQPLGQWTWSGGVRVFTSAPPFGDTNSYTTVRAENVGQAIIDDEIFLAGWSHVTVEGFVAMGGISIDNSDHCVVRKCGARTGISTARSSYIIKEDIWAWYDNRYSIHNYECDHIVDNRVIARLDDTGEVPSGPVGAISHYLTDYSVIANALLFDVSGSFAQPYDLVYSSRPAIGHNKLYGIIGFEPGAQLGGIYPGDAGGGGHEVVNCVLHGTSVRSAIRFNSEGPNKVIGNTLIANSNSALEGQSNLQVDNNIFYNNGGIGGGIAGCDNNLVYNSGAISSACTSTDSSTEPAIAYLPRRPANVSNRGAQIETRYQIELVGNEFILTPTSQALWPWPYEDIIKRDICADSSHGWCNTDKTLTEYVWEYLGNSCPPEICDYSGDTSPPDISHPQPTGQLLCPGTQ